MSLQNILSFLRLSNVFFFFTVSPNFYSAKHSHKLVRYVTHYFKLPFSATGYSLSDIVYNPSNVFLKFQLFLSGFKYVYFLFIFFSLKLPRYLKDSIHCYSQHSSVEPHPECCKPLQGIIHFVMHLLISMPHFLLFVLK